MNGDGEEGEKHWFFRSGSQRQRYNFSCSMPPCMLVNGHADADGNEGIEPGVLIGLPCVNINPSDFSDSAGDMVANPPGNFFAACGTFAVSQELVASTEPEVISQIRAFSVSSFSLRFTLTSYLPWVQEPLNHPDIASIYGLEKQGEILAIAMELAEGRTLADRIKEGPVPSSLVIREVSSDAQFPSVAVVNNWLAESSANGH